MSPVVPTRDGQARNGRPSAHDAANAHLVRLPDGSEPAPHLDDRDETPKERSDRQLTELLQELRVALPGAQFLFAFLLTVPFTGRLGDLPPGGRLVFYACLLCTLTATILLMAPTVHHRVRWQRGDKDGVVALGHAMFLIGMGFLGVAMLAAVSLVTHVLLGWTAAVAATVAGIVMLASIWCATPLLARVSSDGEARRGC